MGHRILVSDADMGENRRPVDNATQLRVNPEAGACFLSRLWSCRYWPGSRLTHRRHTTWSARKLDSHSSVLTRSPSYVSHVHSAGLPQIDVLDRLMQSVPLERVTLSVVMRGARCGRQKYASWRRILVFGGRPRVSMKTVLYRVGRKMAWKVREATHRRARWRVSSI